MFTNQTENISMNDTPKYPHISVNLTEGDSNALTIIGRVRQALRRAGVSQEEIKAYSAEAVAGNYDNLLQVTMKWISCDE